jgi:hypothetical protein
MKAADSTPFLLLVLPLDYVFPVFFNIMNFGSLNSKLGKSMVEVHLLFYGDKSSSDSGAKSEIKHI